MSNVYVRILSQDAAYEEQLRILERRKNPAAYRANLAATEKRRAQVYLALAMPYVSRQLTGEWTGMCIVYAQQPTWTVLPSPFQFHDSPRC